MTAAADIGIMSGSGNHAGLTKAKSVKLHPSENDRQVKWKTCAWGKKENPHDSCIPHLIQMKQEEIHRPEDPWPG